MTRILNRDKICLECEQPVYARYLCRAHYNAVQNRARVERARARREVVREEKRKQAQLNLENNGTVCLLLDCSLLTLREDGLCKAHSNRARTWGFTSREFAGLFAPGQCEICGSSDSLVLDHDHSLGCKGHRANAGCPECFRGLLCNGCNSAIGFMAEEPRRFLNAVKYLENKTFS